ncbi:hypothetical protein H8D91_01600 [archaeon]|nr:hypothetical protein [archaeon]
MEEQIIYPDWKTGKDVIKNIGLVGEVTITKTPLICPFDETPILKSSAHAWESYECPNCKTVYKTDTHTQKEVDVYARNHFPKLLSKLKRLDEGRQNLVAKIQQATEKGLIELSQPKCTRDEFLQLGEQARQEIANWPEWKQKEGKRFMDPKSLYAPDFHSKNG